MYKFDQPSLLFETSRPGRRTSYFPESDVPDRPLGDLIPPEHRDEAAPPLPELGELDIVRHYTNLSTSNMSIDANFYPLGSCTMKYNPQAERAVGRFAGAIRAQHPYQDESTLQGLLQILYETQQFLAEIAGLHDVSLQPAAGAHGEMTALLVASAYFRDQGRSGRSVGPRSSSPTAPTARTPPPPTSPGLKP